MTQPALLLGVPDRLVDRLADYYRAHPLEPIDVQTRAAIAGVSGYRTRESECRRRLGMDIRPEQPRVRWANGKPRPRSIYYPPWTWPDKVRRRAA